jgi:hypothetical protein
MNNSIENLKKREIMTRSKIKKIENRTTTTMKKVLTNNFFSFLSWTNTLLYIYIYIEQHNNQKKERILTRIDLNRKKEERKRIKSDEHKKTSIYLYK